MTRKQSKNIKSKNKWIDHRMTVDFIPAMKRKRVTNYVEWSDFNERMERIEKMIIGLAYSMGLEPVNLFNARYDEGDFPHFHWVPMKRVRKKK